MTHWDDCFGGVSAHVKFGSNMDKPKCWVKNIIKKITVESES